MIAIWLYIPLVTIRKVYLLECDYVKFVSTSVNFNWYVNQLGEARDSAFLFLNWGTIDVWYHIFTVAQYSESYFLELILNL